MAYELKDIRSRCRVEADSGCWLWSGSRTRNGYGQVYHRDGTRYAHRITAELAYGPCPPGLEVLHACDRPPCCNPDHLRYGTRSENVREAFERGLMHFTPRLGEAHHAAVLTEPDVSEIRRCAAAGVTARVQAARFGVSVGQIHNIVQRRSWRHVA